MLSIFVPKFSSAVNYPPVPPGWTVIDVAAMLKGRLGKYVLFTLIAMATGLLTLCFMPDFLQPVANRFPGAGKGEVAFIAVVIALITIPIHELLHYWAYPVTRRAIGGITFGKIAGLRFVPSIFLWVN